MTERNLEAETKQGRLGTRGRSREKLAPFQNRYNFGKYLNEHGLINQAVEVGTHRAGFAIQFLAQWEGKTLHCIDPWVAYDKGDPASVGNRDRDYREAVKLLEPFGSRAEIHRGFSIDVAPTFEDSSLDFVYVDANHQYDHVCRDLRLWWPKLKPGGLLAGHDIVNGAKPGKGWEQFVRPAANEFAEECDTTLWMVHEYPLRNWSYYLVKS